MKRETEPAAPDMERPRTNQRPRRAPWRGIGAGLLLAPALALTPVLGAAPAAQAQIVSPAAGWVDAERILADPRSYFNDTVRVEDEVGRAIGRYAFTLGDQLLVVAPRPLDELRGWPAGGPPAGPVRVAGTVRPFNLRAVERDLGINLNDRAFAPYAGLPVVVARTVNPAPAVEEAPSRFVGVSVDDILDEPASFYGRPVRVNGEIGEALGRYGFTIEDSDPFFDDQLLVIGTRPLAERAVGWPEDGVLGAEATVAVTGTVRRLVFRDIERDYGLTLDEDLYADWEGRPVVVATAVTYQE